MTASLEEYEDVLSSEDGVVDVIKLREYAVHGIPGEVRGQVWLYLLGVVSPEKSTSEKCKKELHLHYNRLDKSLNDSSLRRRVDTAAQRIFQRHEYYRSSQLRGAVRNVLGAYLNHQPSHCTFTPTLLHLLGPLAVAIPTEPELYAALVAVRERIESLHDLERRFGEFLSLFRSVLSDVYQHFEDQELDPSAWLVSWLEGMLANELPLQAVLRLWDFYFADSVGLAMHPYVCIAIIDKCREDVEELEHLDLLTYLQRIPQLDMSEVIVNSDNARRTTDHLL